VLILKKARDLEVYHIGKGAVEVSGLPLPFLLRLSYYSLLTIPYTSKVHHSAASADLYPVHSQPRYGFDFEQKT
jgi:hypothetical protein